MRRTIGTAARGLAVFAAMACSESSALVASDVAGQTEVELPAADTLEPGRDGEDATPDEDVVTGQDVTDDDVTPSDVTTSEDTGPDAGELTWAERFERVIPSTGVVPIALDFPAGDWAALLAAWASGQQKLEFGAAMTHGEHTLPKVGVRLKGLNSLNVPEGEVPSEVGKYPLRIDFNSMGGERLFGVDELRLNNAAHDPSMMRDWLTSEMYRRSGIPAAHIGYGDVIVEGTRVGLYALSQAIDKQFLKERYGTGEQDEGNLYKCVYNGFGACSLSWRGDSRSDYVQTEGCVAGYDECGLVLETNEDDPAKNDYADLIHLVSVLNDTPAEALETQLPTVFDVEQFLVLAAVAFATDNLDSYFGKGHNYFLYHRTDGRFEMIPWDFDLAYGSGCETADFEPTCGGLESHPLVAKIWSVPAWQTRYREHLCTIATEWMTVERHAAWIAALHGRIGALVATDPNPSPEGSYTEHTDLSGAPGSLLDFVKRRHDYLLGACVQNTP